MLEGKKDDPGYCTKAALSALETRSDEDIFEYNEVALKYHERDVTHFKRVMSDTIDRVVACKDIRLSSLTHDLVIQAADILDPSNFPPGIISLHQVWA